MQLGYLRYFLLLERGIQYFPLFVHITYSIGEYTIPKQLSLLLLLHTTKTSPKMGNALHQYIKSTISSSAHGLWHKNTTFLSGILQSYPKKILNFVGHLLKQTFIYQPQDSSKYFYKNSCNYYFFVHNIRK